MNFTQQSEFPMERDRMYESTAEKTNSLLQRHGRAQKQPLCHTSLL